MRALETLPVVGNHLRSGPGKKGCFIQQGSEGIVFLLCPNELGLYLEDWFSLLLT